MYSELKNIIQSSKNIVLFSGAGISCASGIPDFRSANGLYNQNSGTIYRPEEIISHEFLEKRPNLFYEFYKTKMIYRDAKPNLAHLYFAKLEKEGKLKAVITQNIDGLHNLAGNRTVYELHGSIYKNYCTKCGKRFNLDYIMNANGVPKCDYCNGIVRPDVVLYGEALDNEVWENACDSIESADCLIIVGTSLSVQPAASMIRLFKGKYSVLINKQPTCYDSVAYLTINDDIIEAIREEN